MIIDRKGVNTMYNPIKKAKKAKQELSMLYNVPISSIVWKGNNKYIVIKAGKEILI